jgi:ribosomal protein S7
MPRRREIPKRELAPDPLYSSTLVSKFINTVMSDGKRSTAERILYKSFDIIKERTGDDPLKVFKKALDNVKPSLAEHPLARLVCAAARRRQDHAGEVRERVARCLEPARRRGEEA